MFIRFFAWLVALFKVKRIFSHYLSCSLLPSWLSAGLFELAAIARIKMVVVDFLSGLLYNHTRMDNPIDLELKYRF